MKKIVCSLLVLIFINNTNAQDKIPAVKIGSQKWMARNLDVTRYRNGDTIPEVKDQAAWSKLTTGAYCYADNDSAKYGSIYGKLYNWYAVNDPRGLAPKGWHIPNDDEWTRLTTFLGKDSLASKKMTTIVSNGFNGLTGGNRAPNGRFTYIGRIGYWWSSTTDEKDTNSGCSRTITPQLVSREMHSKQRGFSIRCVKD
jgi:uncharacterized protein (TIGR02145 family)